MYDYIPDEQITIIGEAEIYVPFVDDKHPMISSSRYLEGCF